MFTTGFGKSMLFHLLPHFIPVKKTKNIVIVVCPLNSIIEDQLKVLKARGITADVLQLAVNMNEPAENLFEREQEPSEHVAKESPKLSRPQSQGLKRPGDEVGEGRVQRRRTPKSRLSRQSTLRK